MSNENLTNYVKQAKITGLDDAAIRTNLLNAGWSEQEISQALGDRKNWKQIWQDNKKYAIALVVVAVLILAGLKAYSYFASSPDRIWEASIKEMKAIQTAKFKLEASYAEKFSDVSDADDSDLKAIFGSSEFKVSAAGEGAMLIKKESSDIDYDMNSTLTTKVGSLTLGFALESRKIGDNVYYKMEGNPFLSLFGGSEASQKAQWLKVNLKESGNTDFFLTDIQKNQIVNAFNSAKLMSPEKLLGSEKISGVATWHYSARLDKNQLKSYFEQVQDIVQMEEFKDTSALIDKLELKKLELWIGKSDRRVYQAVIESAVPSFVELSLGSARETSRDAKRLADVRQIQTALELFYNDNSRYPASVSGQPVGDDGSAYKFSTYLFSYPAAPTPVSGICTEENNKYFYEQLQKGASYKLGFCLEHDSGGYSAGVMEADPAGIRTKISSNAGEDQSWLADIPFNGTLQIKLNLSDFDSPVTIEEPQDVFDVGTSTRNSKRLADVRQIQTALELFYIDYGFYPFSQSGRIANDNISIYLPTIPEAPAPPDGDCTGGQNQYNYAWISASEYTLTFCLGTEAGGYSGGVHTASPTGIQ